ncbi:MAG: hypothetical protein NTY19_05610, partial [Planctomycetota bacterium]|nr:hypothetical protein [Planctomycetota bacterium]
AGNTDLTLDPQRGPLAPTALSMTKVISITVNPVQDAPTLQIPTTASVNEDATLVFAGHGNEVQQLTFTGAGAPDTFTLTYGTNLTTNSIAWNSIGTTLAGNVQTALDALLGAGTTVVTASSPGLLATITFQGKLANANLTQLTASTLTPSGGTVAPSTLPEGSGNEVQTLTLGGLSGTATLSFGGTSGAVLTAPFAGLQVSELQANLEGIPGLAGNVTVLGATGGPFTLVYGNGLAGRNLPLLGTAVTGVATAAAAPASDGVRVDAVQTLTLTGASGNVTLYYDGAAGTTTVPAAAYTQANVQAAVNSIAALSGNVTVTGNGPFTLTFGKNLEGRSVSPVVAAWSGGSTLATTAPAVWNALLVNDVDQAYDPDWLGQVTLNVGQGVLTLGSTAGLTFSVGTGANDRTLQFTGTLADLNAALVGLTYRGDRDYNTGDPEDGIRTDKLVVTVNDWGNADLTPDSQRTLAAGLTGTHTVTLTVNPVQDAPTIQGPTTASVNEDTTLTFAGHGDEVQQLTFTGAVGGDTFTLTYGTNLTTNPIAWNVNGATLAGNLQAALDPIFGAGNTVVTAASGASATITFQGKLANANLTQLTASALMPSGGTVAPSTPTEGGGNEVQTLTLGGASGTAILSFGGADGAVLTAPYTGLQVSELQANLEGIAGLAGNVTALGAMGGPFTLVYGNVLAGRNLPLLGTAVTDAAAANAAPVSDGVRVDTVQTLTFSGASGSVTLWYDGVAGTAFTTYDQANVQAALDSIPALNGNVTVTGSDPFTLSFGTGLEGRSVSPVVASWSGGSTLATTATAGLGALLVNDVDQAYDPDWLGQVTLDVSQGVLTLGSTAGLTFLVGTGTNDRTLQFTGALVNLNAALAGLTYRGDRDYNLGDPDDGMRTDQLVLTINDLGNTDWRPEASRVLDALRTVRHTVTLTVNPVQDAPTIQGPTTASVNEDATLTFTGHVSEVQQLTFAGELAGDTFTLTYGTNLTTTPIAWDSIGATLAGNMQAALDLLLGAGNTRVTATSGAAATITFQGKLANANLAEFTAISLAPSSGTVTPSTLTQGSGNEVQTLTLSGASGTATLSFGGTNGAPLTAPYAGLQVSELQANLEGISGLAGNVLALGAMGGPFTLVYGNGLAGQNLLLLGTAVAGAATATVAPVSDGVRVDAVQTLTLSGASGNVTLWYDGASGTT